MTTSLKIGFASTMLALAMTFSAPAHAEVLPGYVCDESTLGAFEITTETTLLGSYTYAWGCTDFGWMLYGFSFCGIDGNCSSD